MSEKERQSGDIELSTRSELAEQAEPMLPPPATEKQAPKDSLHPAFYIGTWISVSGLTILFNVRHLKNCRYALASDMCGPG